MGSDVQLVQRQHSSAMPVSPPALFKWHFKGWKLAGLGCFLVLSAGSVKN